MKYDIYLCDLDRKKTFTLPILPDKIPSLERSSKNEEFETFENGTFNHIGAVGLLAFTLECWLPPKGVNYPFQRGKGIDPDEYIQFIDQQRLYQKPIRIIITREDGTTPVNATFSIESFNWHENRMGEYEYTLSVKEWREF